MVPPSLPHSFSLSHCHSSRRLFPHPVKMDCGIQRAMAQLIETFNKYSGKEGDKLTLTKGELKELLDAELGDIFGKTSDKGAMDKIFKDLDSNKDNVVDFQEYVTLVACLTMLCNDFFTKK
ncbi:hypothetical protein AAFF_G00238110 [Aldrovandia affinis]|uniref:Protein S100 n=1 Tax=Aldrovandia affinis TaxID=143900 RepID=A0AAD7RH01_9TELE|nr:hypothetical protein AAFF_G00238110 [Aldrovandia affinis]